uniref:Tetraspanin n=1 Tax=Timema tahoe TaxID=61484 RepID=A0A7R9IHI1_9NEOP|nr:unnamed protein product [Timema tahoe]
MTDFDTVNNQHLCLVKFSRLLGVGILAVGIWAWSEKDTFNNLSRLTNIALDPAFILILVEVKEGFGNQINLCRDRGLNPGPPAQRPDTLPLDHQVTPPGYCFHPCLVNRNEQDSIDQRHGHLSDAVQSLHKVKHACITHEHTRLSKVGTVTFIIGFTGCVGALRENTCLLAAYAIFLAILLLLEMTTGILGFIFKESIKSQATRGFQAFIIHYREDPDQQNLIDWIQEDWLQMFMAMFEAVRLYSNVQLQCCGIESPKDWDRNNYFNCSSQEVGSREACGVPFSCCKRKPNPGERNIFERGCLRAGEEWVEANLVPVAGVAVGVAVLQQFDPAKIINEKGCVQAGEEWMERNLLIVAGIAVATAFLQIPLAKGHNSRYTQIPLAKGHNSRYTMLSLNKEGHSSHFTLLSLDKRDIRDLLCAKPASGHFCPEGKVALTTTGPHCGLADSRCLSANERREGWQLRRKAVTAT